MNPGDDDEPGPDEARRRLLARRDELQALANAGTTVAAARTVELDQTRVGRLSRMDALQSQAMAQEASRRRDQELTQITAALRRIDAGDYGYCVRCGEAVAPARLRHNPAVTLCITCASAAEKN